MQKLSLVCVILCSVLIYGGCESRNPVEAPAPLDEAASLRTFVLASADDPRLPSPLVEDQFATGEERLMVLGAAKTYANYTEVQPAPSVYWNLLTTRYGSAAKLPPPSMARAYALVHVAIYD